MTYYSNELYHYGVKGMKWGVRRYENKDGTLTPAGKKRYYKTSSNKPKEGMDPIVAYYSVILGAAVAKIAIKAGVESVANHNYKRDLDTKRQGEKIDPDTGLHLKPNSDDGNDIDEVNPRYGTNNTIGATNNCVRCTFAYEMRKRGYDVSAKLALDGLDARKVTEKTFPGVKTRVTKRYPRNSAELLTEELIAASEEGDVKAAKRTLSAMSKESNSRGQICVTWNRFGGHSMAYEVKDGNVKIICTQTRQTFEGEEAEKLLAHTCAISYQRLDNMEFDAKNIRRYVV